MAGITVIDVLNKHSVSPNELCKPESLLSNVLFYVAAD